RRNRQCALFEERSRRVIMREQRFEFPTHRVVAVTRFIQERRSVLASTRSRLMVKAVNALPAFRVHDSAEFYANGCESRRYRETGAIAVTEPPRPASSTNEIASETRDASAIPKISNQGPS